jgi:template-activating factor I
MAPKQGKKRAGPGDESEKLDVPPAPHELSEEDSQKLEDVSKAVERVELEVGTLKTSCSEEKKLLSVLLEFISQEKHAPVWEKRRQVLKTIPRFWPTALMNHSLFSIHAAHAQDQAALSHLEDVWVSRNPEEKRCFTIEFVSFPEPYMRVELNPLGLSVFQGEPVLLKPGFEKGI